jgi:hypothetical protein
MRKALFYSGLALLSLGVTFLTVSSIKNVEQRRVASSTGGWEVSANLTKGNVYVFDIWSSAEWRDDFTNGGYEVEQPVDVVMVSPSGSVTRLQAFFLAQLPNEGSYYKGTFPALVYVDYGTVDFDSVDVDRSYRTLRFTSKQGGNYTVQVIKNTLNWTSAPPRELIFYQEVAVDQSSFTFFLQGGGGVCLLAGVAVSGWGVKATKKVRARQKKRGEKANKS